MSARVFVTVGTDIHPFSRLIKWLDRWKADHGDVTLVVQHGHSDPSASGINHSMIGLEELAEEYRVADIVVAQVGPGTIVDANRVGLRPIMVPRDPEFGEVVDDHQYVFGALLEKQGRCVIVTSEDELRAALDGALVDPTAFHLTAEAEGASASQAVGELVAQIVSSPRRRLSLARAWTMIRPPTQS